MTGQEVVLDLLAYLGITGFSSTPSDRPTQDDDDIRKALAAINQSLKTIQLYGPQSMKYGERAAFYNDPTIITVTVNALQGQSATMSTTPPAWMMGCSILIDGDSDLNRIADITGNELPLLRGFRGTNLNNINATVYADCALLNPEIAAVLEPVIVSPNLKCYPARDLDEFLRVHRRWWFDGYGRYETAQPNPGVPGLYFVERRRSGELFLRVAPMPAARSNATFQAKLRAEQVDDGILDETGASDPGYEFVSLAAEEVESILLPLARWKFFAHPDLKNSEPKQAVKDEHDRVMLSLTHGTALDVSSHENRCEYV